jgi:hypothetical protein
MPTDYRSRPVVKLNSHWAVKAFRSGRGFSAWIGLVPNSLLAGSHAVACAADAPGLLPHRFIAMIAASICGYRYRDALHCFHRQHQHLQPLLLWPPLLWLPLLWLLLLWLLLLWLLLLWLPLLWPLRQLSCHRRRTSH